MIYYRNLLKSKDYIFSASVIRVFWNNINIITVSNYSKTPTKNDDIIKLSSSITLNKNNSINDNLKVLRNHLKPFASVEWKEIRQNLIKTQKRINDINVDATILGLLCSNENNDDQNQNLLKNSLNIAKNYIEFLKHEGIELNNAILGRLMKIYYFTYKFDSKQITEEDKKDVLNLYDMIMKKYKILDSITCENLIYGILITNQWKKSLDLLNMIELTCKPSSNVYNEIILRAFNNLQNDDSDEDIGWKLLNEMIINNKQPKCEIFLIYLKRCKQNSQSRVKFQENIEKMFKFLENNEILITRLVANELHKLLLEYNIKSNITKIKTNNGQCNSCKLKIKNLSLTDTEFNNLSSIFLDKVLIRKDVFLKSLPEEVDHFVEFINKTAPYDCVIDGLNVAFSSGVKKNPTVYSKLLASVVKYFVEKNKKVLVIGREHMNKWPKEQMNYIKKNSSLFLTKDLSQDDPFLLYAALKSGPKTDFISRDLMRSHAFLLGIDLKPIFRRWQFEHQYMLLRVNENNEVVIKEPIKYCMSAHKIYSTWHVPFKEVYMFNPSDQFEIPTNWLCISFEKKSS